MKKDVLRNFTNFTGKHLCRVSFLIQLQACNFVKKELLAILRELFIRGRNLSISLVFITQSYFAVSKNLILNSAHYLIMKIQNKHELRHIVFNHSSDIDYNDYETKRQKKKKKKNCENVSYWKFTEVVTVHYNLKITHINMIQEFCIHSY